MAPGRLGCCVIVLALACPALSAAAEAVPGSAIGVVDGLVERPSTVALSGWTCVPGARKPIRVRIYRGAPRDAGGILVSTVQANDQSEPAVAAACGVARGHFRFSAAIPLTVRRSHAGQPLYAYGVTSTSEDELVHSGVFRVPPPVPVVGGVTPSSGYNFGGTPIRIRGRDFHEPLAVAVGGAPCARPVVSAARDEIDCITPPGAEGRVAVSVTNSAGYTDVLRQGFRYVAVRDGDVISGYTISNAAGNCLVLDQPRGVRIVGNAIGPCRAGGLVVRDGEGVVIEGNIVHDTGSGAVFGPDLGQSAAIVVHGGRDVRIERNRLERVHQGIRAIGTRGEVRVLFNEILDVFGFPAQEPAGSPPGMYGRGFGGGAAIGFSSASGPNHVIQGNVVLNEYELSATSDLISVVDSYGASLADPVVGADGRVLHSDPILVKDNWVEGGVEASATGINLGDFSGRFQLAEGNTAVNTSAAGLSVTGGRWIRLRDNRIYSGLRPLAVGFGVSVTNQYYPGNSTGFTAPCEDVEVRENRVDWTSRYGVEQPYFAFPYDDHFVDTVLIPNRFPPPCRGTTPTSDILLGPLYLVEMGSPGATAHYFAGLAADPTNAWLAGDLRAELCSQRPALAHRTPFTTACLLRVGGGPEFVDAGGASGQYECMRQAKARYAADRSARVSARFLVSAVTPAGERLDFQLAGINYEDSNQGALCFLGDRAGDQCSGGTVCVCSDGVHCPHAADASGAWVPNPDKRCRYYWDVPGTPTIRCGPDHSLRVAATGAGQGAITSVPAGIACGSECLASFPPGIVVSLTATAAAGSTFNGWGGDCRSDGTVTLDRDKTCTASFSLTTPGVVALHRLYHAGFGDHFYTVHQSEVDFARSVGYVYEGVEAYVHDAHVAGTTPLHRLYHPVVGDHLYTTRELEVESAQGLGYTYEGIEAYVFGPQAPGTVPLHRLYHPGVHDHFYTVHQAQVDLALSTGYVYEGVECHVFAE